LYEALRKYSFRIFVRDAIRGRKGFTASELSGYSSPATVRRYLRLLTDCGLAERKGRGEYRLVSEDVCSFGDSFAWLVSEVFRREFGCPAIWNVRLARSRAGGDFDVLALVENHLFYIETKSSPPKHVEQNEVGAFLNRVQSLAPQCAIFLEDTQLRMKDKIVPFFEAELPGFCRRIGIPSVSPRRARGEIFQVGSNCFIANSHPGLVRNILFCVSSFLRSRGGLSG